jgi:DNA-directed RNA polymerase specialized sigma24 family protein
VEVAELPRGVLKRCSSNYWDILKWYDPDVSPELPSFVYRAYASDGRLLYVGVTRNVRLRIGQHAATKPWWKDVADVHVDMFPSHREALAAEGKAIREELPANNVALVAPQKKRRRKLPRSRRTEAATYRIDAVRDPTGWWVATVLNVPGAITQCKRLDQVPADAAEAIAVQTGEHVDPATLDVRPIVPGEAGDAAAESRLLRAELQELQERMEERTREAVALLYQMGLSVRDIGTLTGLSHQRVSQINNEAS